MFINGRDHIPTFLFWAKRTEKFYRWQVILLPHIGTKSNSFDKKKIVTMLSFQTLLSFQRLFGVFFNIHVDLNNIWKYCCKWKECQLKKVFLFVSFRIAGNSEVDISFDSLQRWSARKWCLTHTLVCQITLINKYGKFPAESCQQLVANSM